MTGERIPDDTDLDDLDGVGVYTARGSGVYFIRGRIPAGYVVARPHPAPLGRTPEGDRAIRFVTGLIQEVRV